MTLKKQVGETVTIVSVSDVSALYAVSIATAHAWRRPRGVTMQEQPRVYTRAKGSASILGERLAHVSSTDVYDLDQVIANVRRELGREPQPAVDRRLRDTATVPTSIRVGGLKVPLVLAGLAEVGFVLGIDKRVVAVMDGRGLLPAPVALVGSAGTPTKVYAAWQFQGDARYSQERVEALARLHRYGVADAVSER